METASSSLSRARGSAALSEIDLFARGRTVERLLIAWHGRPFVDLCRPKPRRPAFSVVCSGPGDLKRSACPKNSVSIRMKCAFVDTAIWVCATLKVPCKLPVHSRSAVRVVVIESTGTIGRTDGASHPSPVGPTMSPLAVTSTSRSGAREFARPTARPAGSSARYAYRASPT